MDKVTIGFGLALIALGLGAFVAAGGEGRAVTGLIPTFVGVPLLLLGLIAWLKPGTRKVVMHVAVVIAFLGFLAPVGRIAAAGLPASTLALTAQVGMAVLCAALTVAYIYSFIKARRQRTTALA